VTFDEYLDGVDFSHPMTTGRDHIARLCRAAQQVVSVLELGSHAGISAAAMALANPVATVVSVDLCDAVPEADRVAYWGSLGIKNIHPFATTAFDYLRSSPKFGMVFHDAAHGNAVMHEYLRCLDIADIVAIHDFEQLSSGNRALIVGMFASHEITADDKGRELFVGWA
jgi:predicted O-methyltransferase YrrM